MASRLDRIKAALSEHGPLTVDEIAQETGIQVEGVRKILDRNKTQFTSRRRPAEGHEEGVDEYQVYKPEAVGTGARAIAKGLTKVPGVGALAEGVLSLDEQTRDRERDGHIAGTHETLEEIQEHLERTTGRQATGDEDELRAAYRKHYVWSAEYLYVQFRGIRQLDTLVDLKLEDIYVALEAAPEAPSGAPEPDEAELRQRLLDRDLPDEEREARETQFHELRQQRAAQARPTPAQEVIREKDRLVILGDPGSGKTTLVHYLAQSFARGPDTARQRLGIEEDRLPIVVRVGRFASAIAKTETDYYLCDYIHDAADADHGEGMGEFLLGALERAECVVLLDGLDEIPGSALRVRVANLINHFLGRAEFTGNRVVVTSRIYGYAMCRLHGLSHVVLAPFGRQQIEAFAHQWCGALERALHPDSPDLERAEEDADALCEAIFDRPDVESFASNPLLLTLLALIRRRGVPLPERRVELYELALRTLIETWNEGRAALAGVPLGERLDYQETVRVWAPVALWMHENFPTGAVHRAQLTRRLAEELEGRGHSAEAAETTAESYIESAARQVGLLQARGPEAFAFLHQTFQEYLAAQALASPARDLPARVADRLPDPRWREVLLLCMGFVGAVRRDEETVTDVLEQLLDPEHADEWEPYLLRRLRFAAQCLADRVNIDPSLEQRIVRNVVYAMTQERPLAVLQSLTEAVAGLEHVEPRAETIDALVGVLGGDEIAAGQAAMFLLGNAKSAAPTAAAELRRCRVRTKYFELDIHAWMALARLGAVTAQDAVPARTPAWAWFRVAKLPPGRGLAGRSRGVREGVARRLAQALREGHAGERLAAVRVLRELGEPAASEELLSALVARLRDEAASVRQAAAEALGQLGERAATEAVLSDLLEALKDEEGDMRARAASTLGQLGERAATDPVLTGLLQALGDEDRSVRGRAAEALALLGQRAATEPVLTGLLHALGDEDISVRGHAACALAVRGEGAATERVLTGLLDALGDEDRHVRASAASALLLLGEEGPTEPVLTGLVHALSDEDIRVRGYAAYALAVRGEGAAAGPVLTGLVRRLRDDSTFPRLGAACALGWLGERAATEPVLTGLLDTLEAEETVVRGSAADALGLLGERAATEPVLSGLLQALGDEDAGVRWSAAGALANLVKGRRGLKLARQLRERLEASEDEKEQDGCYAAIWYLLEASG